MYLTDYDHIMYYTWRSKFCVYFCVQLPTPHFNFDPATPPRRRWIEFYSSALTYQRMRQIGLPTHVAALFGPLRGMLEAVGTEWDRVRSRAKIIFVNDNFGSSSMPVLPRCGNKSPVTFPCSSALARAQRRPTPPNRLSEGYMREHVNFPVRNFHQRDSWRLNKANCRVPLGH